MDKLTRQGGVSPNISCDATPEMASAGVEVLIHFSGEASREILALLIWEAMASVFQNQMSGDHGKGSTCNGSGSSPQKPRGGHLPANLAVDVE